MQARRTFNNVFRVQRKMFQISNSLHRMHHISKMLQGKKLKSRAYPHVVNERNLFYFEETLKSFTITIKGTPLLGNTGNKTRLT